MRSFQLKMTTTCFIQFNQDIKKVPVPKHLNDPFETSIPEIAQVATEELKEYLKDNQDYWLHDFGNPLTNTGGGKGKMFGVLVVKNEDDQLGYLATFSGKIADEPHPSIFVPSLFDISTDDFFITKGMTALTEMGNQIKALEAQNEKENQERIEQLKIERKDKSITLQERLFEQYDFLNSAGESKSLIKIFKDFNQSKPAAGSGECSAPKLLQYAYNSRFKPISIAEFWWGKSTKSADRVHGNFYPACDDKCRPILSHMLSH